MLQPKTFMRLPLFTFLTVLLSACSEQKETEPILVLRGATVIDCTGEPAQADMTVVITGNRITELGKAGKVEVPKDARVVDATSKFLIPGLWDMHIHISYSGWFAPEDTWFIENRELNKEIFFPLLVANGVTGMRDLGGDLATLQRWRQEIRSGKIIGPRIIAAGPIVDGPRPSYPFSVAVANATHGRQVVDSLKKEGADFIKVRSLSSLSRDVYFAIADECKKQGMTFVGHVPDIVTAAEASDAGQKSIEHFDPGWLVSLSHDEELRKGSSDWKRFLDTYSNQKAALLFKRFVKNDTWFCPTIVLLMAWYFPEEIDITNYPGLQYIPAYWIKKVWKPFVESRIKNMTAEKTSNLKGFFQESLELVLSDMRLAGVQFLAGTDTGGINLIPGFSLHEELVFLVRGGLTTMEALQAATGNPARFLGMLDSLGTVEVGKIADLVLLDANPLEDINNTQRINAVVLGGKFLPKESLQKMLAAVEAAASKM